MKEFIKNQKVTYNLMSFTGFKALLIFNLLTEGPKTYKEISNYIYNHPYLREEISIDTFRVYINSLKRIGCEVKRLRGEDKISRYVITAHPFELKLSEDEITSLTKVYKNIVRNMDAEELLSMDNFFEKIGKYIKDDEFAANLRQYSPVRNIDKNLLKTLIDCCSKKEQIVITYNSPNSGEKQIELIADKVDISNGKVYLFGIGFECMQYGNFLVNRIKCINEIKIEKTIPDTLKELKIKYELKCEPEKLELDDNEKLIEVHDNKAIIELTTSNEFLARQKLLEFGPMCTILEPESFKEKFVNTLKDMKAGYYCD